MKGALSWAIDPGGSSAVYGAIERLADASRFRRHAVQEGAYLGDEQPMVCLVNLFVHGVRKDYEALGTMRGGEQIFRVLGRYLFIVDPMKHK